MAIVKMHKFNLYTFATERERLLKTLQKFKNVHLSQTKNDEEQENLSKVEISEQVTELDTEINRVQWTLDLLKTYTPKPSTIDEYKGKKIKLSLEELKEKSESFNFNEVHGYLNTLVLEKNEINQKIANINEKIKELEPFIDLKVSGYELNKINRTKIMTGNIPIRNEVLLNSALESSGLSFYSIEEYGIKNGLKYLIVSVDHSEEDQMSTILRANGFTNVRIKTDLKVEEEIDRQNKKIEDYNLKILDIDAKISNETRQLEALKYYYEYLRNESLRKASAGKFLKSKTIDLINGYVPSNLANNFIKALDNEFGSEYYLEIEEAKQEDENVPIKLKNNKLIEPFETITEMYAVPRYQEVDPTPLLAPFYFVFSGIMIGDMGYGIMVTIVCLLALKILKPDKSLARMIKFIMYMGISSILWGFIFGSFFGDLIPIKAYMNPSEDYMSMIAMCMLFGVIHIFFAMAIKAYINIRDKKPLDALFDVGFWYMALIGAIVFVGSKVITLGEMIGKVSMIVMLIGMVGILFTGGRDQESTAGKIGWGVYALYGISSYLSDFVSYFRLMALALSGSFIAIAVNIIVRMLMEQGIIGVIFGIFIFIAFQIFNMFLSFLSSYVHSARLTFVEMFNKFYEGGGVPFKEMVTNSEYFIIEED